MAEANDIEYDSSAGPTPEELLEFYARQQHATTRSKEKLQRMVEASFCFVTARKNGELIGWARGTTDGIRGLLVECKLDPAYQGPACVTHTDGRIEHDSAGIARAMGLRVIEAFRRVGVERVDVLAYGTEEDFCQELGFKRSRGLVAMHLDPSEAVVPSQDAGGSADG